MISGVIVDLANREEGDLIVEFKLVGDLRYPRLEHRSHVVIPPVDAFLLEPPIRRPAEVGGIDVGGEALLEAMQLIGADEMHLSRKAGAVALESEVMRPGRDGGREFRSVVVDTRS